MNEPIPHSAIGAVRLAFNYLPDSSRQSAALLDKQDVIRLEAESAVSSSATLSELPDKSAPTQPSVENAGSDPATLQPETEAMFIELIEQAVRAGDLNKAMAIVKDAERAGSTKARDALVNSLK
jgi:maltose operon protein